MVVSGPVVRCSLLLSRCSLFVLRSSFFVAYLSLSDLNEAATHCCVIDSSHSFSLLHYWIHGLVSFAKPSQRRYAPRSPLRYHYYTCHHHLLAKANHFSRLSSSADINCSCKLVIPVIQLFANHWIFSKRPTSLRRFNQAHINSPLYNDLVEVLHCNR